MGQTPEGRDVGLGGAFSIGIGGIVGGGIFATLGLAGAEARGATHLAFLVGGVVALLTAYSYVRLTLAFPGKGGTVTFLNRAFGTGLFSGGLNALLVLSYVVVMALYAGAFASYGSGFLPAGLQAAGRRVLAPGIIVLLALVNFVGPGLVEKSEGIFNVVKLGILLCFVVVGLGSPGLTLARLSPADWVSPSKIVASGMLVFLSYEGFELIANASDRIRQPHRTLPWAYYGSVAAAMVLYVLIVVVAIGHLSFEALSAAKDRSLAVAAEAFLGRFGFLLLTAGAVVAGASAINADFFGASKLPVILAEEQEMPGIYGRELWGRNPLSLALIAVWAVVIAAFVDLHAVSAVASAGFLVVFGMVNVANTKLARETESRAWVSGLAAVSCFAALAVMLLEILAQPEHVHAAWLVLGLLVLPFAYEAAYRTWREVLSRSKGRASG